MITILFHACQRYTDERRSYAARHPLVPSTFERAAGRSVTAPAPLPLSSGTRLKNLETRIFFQSNTNPLKTFEDFLFQRNNN